MWFLFIERKPKTEDKQTIAMLRSKIYTLEQELEQQKNQKVCWGVPNCVDYTIFQWGCLLGLNRMNFAERGRWQIDEEFLQTYFKICLQDPRISYILLILLCFPYGDCKSLNQLLFANEKILRGSREPHRHKIFSPQTSSCGIVVISAWI